MKKREIVFNIIIISIIAFFVIWRGIIIIDDANIENKNILMFCQSRDYQNGHISADGWRILCYNGTANHTIEDQRKLENGVYDVQIYHEWSKT